MREGGERKKWEESEKRGRMRVEREREETVGEERREAKGETEKREIQ